MSKRELNLTAEAIRLLDAIYRWKEEFIVGDTHICRYCGRRKAWTTYPTEIRHSEDCVYYSGDLKAFFDRIDVGQEEH